MAHGPGKYDEICTEVRERLNALGIVLIVIQGDKGDGFEVQVIPELAGTVADALALIVPTIRAEMNEVQH